MKLYMIVLALVGAATVSRAQLRGLENMLAGPRGRMLKMLAYASPVLRRGLATIQDMKVARTLGCRPAFDHDSPLLTVMPSGCTVQKDICPYTKPMNKCVQVGMIGMCCPYMVNSYTIKSAKVLAKWRKMAEVMT